jgi:hypothetical protein
VSKAVVGGLIRWPEARRELILIAMVSGRFVALRKAVGYFDTTYLAFNASDVVLLKIATEFHHHDKIAGRAGTEHPTA